VKDYMNEIYTPFEQNLALAWAAANFSLWRAANETASPKDAQKEFFSFVEGGLSLALDFREKNA